jgi:hypothetical protein
MLAKIIPMQPRVDPQHVIRGSLGDLDAIRAEIKRRGFNLERFLEPPKQIEAVAKEPEHSGNGQDDDSAR